MNDNDLGQTNARYLLNLIGEDYVKVTENGKPIELEQQKN